MEQENLTTIKVKDKNIDYKVGDWVETCDMLPGIVESIDTLRDEVRVFYPHYALQYPGEYYGGSSCSIDHCGVHKITPQYACKLLAIGRDRLKIIWDEMAKTKIYNWEDRVEKYFNELYPNRK